MKQFLQKGMATKLLCVMVAFFMMGSLVVKAQTPSSGGSSQFSGANSANALTQVTKPKPVAGSYPTSSKTKDRPFTKADGGDLVQIGEDKYQSWNDAVEALKENDVIILLQDIELKWGDDIERGFKIPKVACTVQGTTGSTVLKSTSTIKMEAPVTFKSVTLDLKELVACGNPLVFDENVTCTNQNMTVCGGSDFYEEGVEIKSTSITIKSGTYHTVYGGGFYAGVTGDTHIEVQGGSIDYIYGGGSDKDAICENTDLTIEAGTFGQSNDYRYNVMGGGEAAPVTGKAKVTINGGTFNCFVTAGGGRDDATTATCGSTELNITGGTFTKWTYGGGWASPVLGTAKVKVSGSPTLATLCGGGVRATAVSGSTDINITAGTLGHINGGGEGGNVTGECHLSISGSPVISGNVFGGSNESGTTVGSTKVEISGGTIAYNVFGGGWGCNVLGDTHVSVTGGTITYNVFGGGSQGQVFGSTNVVFEKAVMTSGKTIYGGGWGDDNLEDGYSMENGRVGNANVTIKGSGSGGLFVCGNGPCSSVVNDVNITVDGGENVNVFGLFCSQDYDLKMGGNLSIVLNNGDIRYANLVVNDLMEENTIGGKACITVSPDIEATNLSDISSGNPQTGVLKDATFIFKNCGTAEQSFEIPYTLKGFTTVELDNSYVKSKNGNSSKTGVLLDMSKSNTFVGKGWCQPINVGPYPFNTVNNINEMETAFKLDATDVATDVFNVYPENMGTYGFFKVGNTYRIFGGKGNDFFSAVTIYAVAHGSLSVSWRDTKLVSGDEVPFRDVSNVSIDSKLTVEAQPDNGYRLREGSLKVYKTGDENTLVDLNENVFILPEYDVTVTAEFEQIYVPPVIIPTYYTVTLPSVEGVTLSRKAGDYTVEEGYSFSFGLTLNEGYGQSRLVVKANGTEIVPRQSDGKYVVRNVEEDILITIEGIMKDDPTANAVVQGGDRIYALRNVVYIERVTPLEAQILTIGGRVVRSLHLVSGSNQVTGLQPGVYVIHLSDGQTEKVSIR